MKKIFSIETAIGLTVVALIAALFWPLFNQPDRSPIEVEVIAISYTEDAPNKTWLHKDGYNGATLVQSKDGFRFHIRGDYTKSNSEPFTVLLGYYNSAYHRFKTKNP